MDLSESYLTTVITEPLSAFHRKYNLMHYSCIAYANAYAVHCRLLWPRRRARKLMNLCRKCITPLRDLLGSQTYLSMYVSVYAFPYLLRFCIILFFLNLNDSFKLGHSSQFWPRLFHFCGDIWTASSWKATTNIKICIYYTLTFSFSYWTTSSEGSKRHISRVVACLWLKARWMSNR